MLNTQNKRSAHQVQLCSLPIILHTVLVFFIWAQSASVVHGADHVFHASSVYCDALLAAQAQPAQIHSPTLFKLVLQAVEFEHAPVLIALPDVFSWTSFSPRAPPLGSSANMHY